MELLVLFLALRQNGVIKKETKNGRLTHKANAHFIEGFHSGKYLATNRNKGRVLHLSTAFIGNSVFWKPNYFAEENDEKYEMKGGKKVKVRTKYNFKGYFYS